MNFKEYKKRVLKNKAFREEYDRYDLAFEISHMIIEARLVKGITQKGLADLAGTKQPAIARLENGHLPSLTFLNKIAKALEMKIEVNMIY
jgi:predicted transcriptional regulator